MSNEITLLQSLLAARKRDLNLSDLATLLIIEPEPVSLVRISELLGVCTATVTGIADKLEKQKYAIRQPAPHDRRKWLLTITPSGQAALEAITTP